VQVLAALERQRYDLILMDIHMPEMDGLEASQKIQQLYAPHLRPRIIALSADTLTALREQCVAAGIEEFISKPFRVEDLKRVVASLGPRAQQPPQQQQQMQPQRPVVGA
jgi:CheY-like chemotaxis protein